MDSLFGGGEVEEGVEVKEGLLLAVPVCADEGVVEKAADEGWELR